MKMDILTNMLANIVVAFDRGADYLFPTIQWLLFILMGLEVIWLGLKMASDESNQRILPNIMKLLFIMFWGWLTLNFHELAKLFVESLIRAGEIAGGASAPCGIMNPSCIVSYGLESSAKLEILIKNSEFSMVDAFVIGLGKAGIILAYVLMGIQVTLAVAEYYLVLVLAGVFMPFGIMQHTKFMAEKGIGAIIAAGVKLMVLTFLLAVLEPLLLQITFEGEGNKVTMSEIYAFFAAAWFMALFIWLAPSMAAGYLSGQPSLSGGAAVGATAGAAAGAIGGASGLTRGTIGAKNLGSAVYQKSKSAAYHAAALGTAAAGKLRGK